MLRTWSVLVLVLCLAPASLANGVAFASSAPLTPAPGAAAPAAVSDELLADERAAVIAVDAFWRDEYKDNYQPPQVRGHYTQVNAPSCAGKRLAPDNAFYCHPHDFVAWGQDLMIEGYQRIGNAWVFLIIAHEWGHAMQARVNKAYVSRAAELQADCLAGAALTGAVAKGVLVAQPSAAEHIEQTLAAIGDRFPWASAEDHGNALERVRAYRLGQRGGRAACFGTS
jgi:predicted metalloprotease